MRSENAIVITSIFEPTEAVRKFSKFSDWTVIVVGDRKSPPSWRLRDTVFISAAEQATYRYRLVRELPWNHYCRKMVGYLRAMELGAKVIYDTDDDNIPLANWRQPAWEARLRVLHATGFVNIYKYFTKARIWPRGLPLGEVLKRGGGKIARQNARADIWQLLANGDPDVDAIYRLTINQPVTFDRADPIVLGEGAFCPINSQNTFFSQHVFALLYLPSFVTFRFTDILRGLVAQPILWAAGRYAGFAEATVEQKRNVHDYMKDFESELPVYLLSQRVTELASEAVSSQCAMAENLVRVYTRLERAGIVTKAELRLLRAWVKDVEMFNK